MGSLSENIFFRAFRAEEWVGLYPHFHFFFLTASILHNNLHICIGVYMFMVKGEGVKKRIRFWLFGYTVDIIKDSNRRQQS